MLEFFTQIAGELRALTTIPHDRVTITGESRISLDNVDQHRENLENFGPVAPRHGHVTILCTPIVTLDPKLNNFRI